MMEMGKGKCFGAFCLLDERICAELLKLGISTPTDVQEKAIPVILSGRDALIIAPTGSGKTEAAMLPLFHKLIKEKGREGAELPRLIYITPLRALNRDIFLRMERLSRAIGLSCIVRHGDSTANERRAFLIEPMDWFVTTQESFVMMLSHEKTRERLRGIKYVVIDEIHELIDSERGSELEVALRRLRLMVGSYQLVGLSATIWNEELLKGFYPFKRGCAVIKSDHEKRLSVVVDTSGLEGFMNNEKHLDWLISKLAEIKRRYRSAIIFTNTRNTSEFLGFQLRERGFDDIAVHHGSLSIDVRKGVEASLKEGSLWGVVATSSLELGIDIGHLDLVIQYGSPRQALRLVQRAGRSGHRLGEESKAIILAEPLLDDIVESAVIARRAVEGLLEPQEPHRKPLDVLLHQLVGMVLAGEVKDVEEALGLLRATSTFKDLDMSTFNEVIEYASQTNLVRVTGNAISPGRRARSYFFSTNMIPDTKKIPVYASYGEKIGYLDGDFVLAKLAKGSRFVLAGREWDVQEIGDDKVIVRPAETRAGIPPAWEGELIPVDYKVAREECDVLYRAAMEGVEKILTTYPYLSEAAAKFIGKVVEEALSHGYLPPSHRYVLIETDESDKLSVIYSCLGSKGNDALAILIGHYITTRLGYKVAYSSDPLRIFIEMSKPGVLSVVEKVLLELAANARSVIDEEAERAVKGTNLFLWKLSQVAKKMGIISPDASLREASRLVKYLGDTIAGKEALRELLTEKLDFPLVSVFLADIAQGRRKIITQTRRGLSPYTTYGGRASTLSVTQTQGMPTEIAIRMLEKRALEKEVLLVCLNCGYRRSQVVESLPDEIVCGRCGAKIITPIPAGFEEMINAVDRYLKLNKDLKQLSDREKELVREAIERAELVLTHGKKAVIALSVYGVGPRSARRALSALKFGWEEFLKTLYEEQVNWFRTREYWD